LENRNSTASSASSLHTATTDVSVTTLFTPNKFTIFLGTVKIKDVTTTNGTIKAINIQGTDGVIQIVDKVLQPFVRL
jgi:hypothetical protein